MGEGPKYEALARHEENCVQEDAGEKEPSRIHYFLILRAGVNYVSKNLNWGVSFLSIYPMFRPSSPLKSPLGSKVSYMQDRLMKSGCLLWVSILYRVVSYHLL